MLTCSSFNFRLHFSTSVHTYWYLDPVKKDIHFIHIFLGRKDVCNEFVGTVLAHLAFGLEKFTDLN